MRGCEGIKPGWVRVNFNYFLSETQFNFILDAIHLIANEGWRLLPHYRFDPDTGEWRHRAHSAVPVMRLSEVSYRTGKMDLIMLTKDPTGTCAYEIPMCIPACCVGDPLISERRGIFGRGIVEYRWACGFRAIVKFRHVLGDIRVDYEGD